MNNNDNNDKYYSKGYVPNVCIADYTIKYFPNKYKEKLLGTDKEKEHATKFVESVHVLKESILLNDKSQFVNEQLKISHLKRLLGRRNIKYSEDFTYVLRNLKIHSHSKAMYSVHKEK
tara:strand:+ start:749 stop:1102 length:354 start_codon:yes stop_codon:yes gene_type:complete